jgi:hypothetical protein
MIYDEVLDAPAYFIDKKQVLPFNLISEDIEKIDSDIRKIRMEVCLSCEKLEQVNCCSECGCWMSAKTWIRDAKCPLDKW